MTREEAIKELSVGYLGDSEKIKEAKRMAIKALEQEHCEDVISRQAVLERAYKIAGYDRSAYVVDVADIEALPSVSCLENPNRCDDAVSKEYLKKDMIRYGWKHPDSTVTEYVDNLPSASTEKTGQWKRISMDLYIQHATAYYRCSECGHRNVGISMYCPNCGAKMEVEE